MVKFCLKGTVFRTLVLTHSHYLRVKLSGVTDFNLQVSLIRGEGLRNNDFS